MITNWQSKDQLTDVLTDREQYWLFGVKRLSRTLAEYASNLSLSKIIQGNEALLDEDKKFLEIEEDKGHVRLIRHVDGVKNIVLGRTVIPMATYKHFKEAFDHLENKSIGEHILFRSHAITRGEFYVRQYSLSEVQRKFHHLIKIGADKIWSRASVFYIGQKDKLLVEEFFLSIPKPVRQA